jgi:hypothetical protein
MHWHMYLTHARVCSAPLLAAHTDAAGFPFLALAHRLRLIWPRSKLSDSSTRLTGVGISCLCTRHACTLQLSRAPQLLTASTDMCSHRRCSAFISRSGICSPHTGTSDWAQFHSLAISTRRALVDVASHERIELAQLKNMPPASPSTPFSAALSVGVRSSILHMFHLTTGALHWTIYNQIFWHFGGGNSPLGRCT